MIALGCRYTRSPNRRRPLPRYILGSSWVPLVMGRCWIRGLLHSFQSRTGNEFLLPNQPGRQRSWPWSIVGRRGRRLVHHSRHQNHLRVVLGWSPKNATCARGACAIDVSLVRSCLLVADICTTSFFRSADDSFSSVGKQSREAGAAECRCERPLFGG